MRRHAWKQVTKRRWMIPSVIAVVILLAGIGYYLHTLQSKKSTETTAQTTAINTGDIILSGTGPGTLISGEEVSFGFENGGQVTEVLAGLGEKVEAGEILARLENKTLTLKYKQAAANLAALSTPSEIAAAEQAVQDAKDSLATARNDLQFKIGPEMMVAEDEVANAQRELDAAKAAAEQDSSNANQQKVSKAEAALTQAHETLTYAYYNYSNSYTLHTFIYPIRNSQGTTIRRELIAPTEAELSAAHATYELAQLNLSDAQNYLDVLNGRKTAQEVPASSLTSLTEAKLALDSAEAELRATELTAPISGTITSIDLNVGEEAGTAAVVTISDLDQPYTLDVYLDETDWDKAKAGSAATVTFDLLPDEGYPAQVTEVYPLLDDSSGTAMVHILVRLDDPIKADLPVGSTASVDIVGGEARGAVLVPVSALQEVASGNYVVYLMKNGEPVEQNVEIGLQDILYAEVKSGLQKGDVVLTDATTVNP